MFGLFKRKETVSKAEYDAAQGQWFDAYQRQFDEAERLRRDLRIERQTIESLVKQKRKLRDRLAEIAAHAETALSASQILPASHPARRTRPMTDAKNPGAVEDRLIEAQAIASCMYHRNDCTASPDHPGMCGCGLNQLNRALTLPAAQPAAKAGDAVPVCYLVEHKGNDDMDTAFQPLTEADKAAGWTETPLYAAPPSPQPDMVSGEVDLLRSEIECLYRLRTSGNDEGRSDEAVSLRAIALGAIAALSPASQSVEKDALKAAYEAGALAVHEYWQNNPGEAPRGDPEFGEAASDYAATLPHKEEATPAPVGEQGAWSDDISMAPAACHVLAARRDPDSGEWMLAVVRSPPIKPFTHWRMLDTPDTKATTERGRG